MGLWSGECPLRRNNPGLVSDPSTPDAWEIQPIHAQPEEKLAPCRANCPSGIDIRGWISIIAQREKTGLGRDEAIRNAWLQLVAFNPLPAVLGRICPHPCEDECNRKSRENAVSVHAMERFIGDWALAHRLPLPVLESSLQAESIGVIGSGPAGLSFAYQMARRGYPVTIYEQHQEPGGMLYYGIPQYRLPKIVLRGEIDRIRDLGVTICLGTRVGVDIPVAELHRRHRAVFLSIGANRPLQLQIPGENGPDVLTGIDFMHTFNEGRRVNLGIQTVVVGGGNTAIDVARAARRLGTAVTLLYRRTRREMTAIASEVEEALIEGVDIRFLSTPTEVLREEGRVVAVRVQRMALREPDVPGKRPSVDPIPGETYDLPANTLIVAISQTPDWSVLGGPKPQHGQWVGDENGRIADNLWSGGDVLELSNVTCAVGQGRRAAEALHAQLRGFSPPIPDRRDPVRSHAMHLDYYPTQVPAETVSRPTNEWLANPTLEIHGGLTLDQFLQETSRCLSCGSCFGCQHCWMFCNARAYTAVTVPGPGAYYTFDQAACEGCGQCMEICPTGYLSAKKDAAH